MSSIWKKIGKHLRGAVTGGFSYLNDGLDEEDIDPLNLDQSDEQKKAEDLADEQWQWQKDKYDENFAFQREQYEYQKELNRMQMEREDTAVRRRVADLREAGLSPTLAAGSAANATPVHAGTAPQYEVGSNPKIEAAMFKERLLQDRIALALTAMSNYANVARTKSEVELMKAKTGEQDIVNMYLSDYLSGRNIGVNLSNDAQRIANSFASDLNKSKIDQLQKGLAYMDSQIKQNEALTELTKERRFTEIKDQILKGLQQSSLSAQISKSYLDQMATAYSLRWYVEHDLPYGSTAQNALILNALDKSMKFLNEGGLFHSYGVLGVDKPLPAEKGGINFNNARKDDGTLKGLKDSIFWPLIEPFVDSAYK